MFLLAVIRWVLSISVCHTWHHTISQNVNNMVWNLCQEMYIFRSLPRTCFGTYISIYFLSLPETVLGDIFYMTVWDLLREIYIFFMTVWDLCWGIYIFCHWETCREIYICYHCLEPVSLDEYFYHCLGPVSGGTAAEWYFGVYSLEKSLLVIIHVLCWYNAVTVFMPLPSFTGLIGSIFVYFFLRIVWAATK
jgi:hypothetical protein